MNKKQSALKLKAHYPCVCMFFHGCVLVKFLSNILLFAKNDISE